MNFRADYAVELETALGRERLVKAIEKRSRAVIACPIEGVAQNLTYHRIGGVVAPADATMQIVPSRERLPIIPGMQAATDIHTGKKRLHDKLIQPVLKTGS